VQGRGILRDTGGGGSLGKSLDDVYIDYLPQKNYSANGLVTADAFTST
jgi:hypothetical protein